MNIGILLYRCNTNIYKNNKKTFPIKMKEGMSKKQKACEQG